MGVPVPDAAVGRVAHDLALALAAGAPAERGFARHLARVGGLVFASRWLHDAMEPTDLRRLDRIVLGRILALDQLIANPDRTFAHPNLLVQEQQLYAIDHAQGIPWYDTPVELPSIKDHHVATVLGVAASAFELPDADIEAAVATVPAGWWTPTELRDRVLDGLLERAESLRRGVDP
jgi:hypothetical protein